MVGQILGNFIRFVHHYFASFIFTQLIIQIMEKDCFFGSSCQTNEECVPCGFICAWSNGEGQCITDPGGEPNVTQGGEGRISICVR